MLAIRHSARGWIAPFVLALSLLGATCVATQAEDEPPQVPAADEEVPQAPGPAADDEPSEEGRGAEDATRAVLHKVYVPFRDLSKIFEKEGEGVFLPYAEFLDLWRRANRSDRAPEGPPLDVAIRAASYEGSADGDLLTLRARLEIEVLAKGWQRLPLDFAGAGLETATLDGAPALVVPAAEGRYELLVDAPGRRTLEVLLQIPVAREGERRKASFALPPVPLSRLDLAVPGRATDIDVTPRIAASTKPAEDGTTHLLAFLGPVGRIEIAWRAREEDQPALQPLLFAEERHDVRVDPGVVRVETVVSLSVLRAPLARLTLSVPKDAVTLYVQGEGLRTWQRSEDGRELQLELREAARDKWEVRVGLERPLVALPADVDLPLLAVEGVERETGFLRVLAGEGVKAEPASMEGLLQIDVSELPEGLKEAPAGRTLAWRFPARPGAARVRVEALEPRVDVEIGTRVTLRQEGTDVETAVTLRVDRAGIFGVELPLPADLEITAVKVLGPVAYDDHRVEVQDGQRRLVVSFRDRLLGAAVLEIQGRRPTPLPPEDDAAAESMLDVPLLGVVGADHVRGYVAVHVDPALEHREVSKTGLTPIDANTPAAQEPPAARPPLLPLALRYEHHEGDVALRLALKRRAPDVTAGVETAVGFEPDRMRLAVTLRYEVRYRAVDTFRFTAPLAVRELLHLTLEGVQLLGPEPLALEEGEPVRGLWTVKLPSPRMGEVPIVLELEDVPDTPLTSGAARPVTIPTFVPQEADGKPLPNVVHHTAVRRDPLLEVASQTLVGAEEIDARELPAAMRSEDDFLAYRAYEPDWSATLLVTRHDYEPVAEVVVSQMHLDTVVHEDRGTTEAYLVVRNNDRQYLKLRLPPGASIRALTVDGQSRQPRKDEEGDENVVLLPLLAGLGKDQAFVVAIAYDHDVERSEGIVYQSWKAASPEPLDVTADLLTWRLYLPAELDYTSLGGTLEPQRPYQSWFSTLVDQLFSALKSQQQTAQVDVARAVRGFESPFASRREGTMILFSNRVGTGAVEATGVAPGTFAFLKILAFAFAFVAVLALARLSGRTGFGEGTLVLAVVLVLLVLLVRADLGASHLLTAMLGGALLAGLVRFALHAAAARRAAREAAAAAEPEPPEELPDEPAPEGGAA